MQIGIAIDWRSPSEPSNGVISQEQAETMAGWVFSYGGSANPGVTGAGSVSTLELEGAFCLLGLTIQGVLRIRALARK